MFGLIIMTGKSYRAERKQFASILLDAHDKVRAAEADRNAADKQIERLLHSGFEVNLLWAAVRQCGVDKQVGVVYERLRPKTKGDKQ